MRQRYGVNFPSLSFAASRNLTNQAHLDVGDDGRCFAIWARRNLCTPPPPQWWLLFPSVGLAIQLADGVRISWDGRHAMHCSMSVPSPGDELLSLFVAEDRGVASAHRKQASFRAGQRVTRADQLMVGRIVWRKIRRQGRRA
jgi:hypothetical protein